MNRAGSIISINPPHAIPGGEIIVNCENFEVNSTDGYGCFFNGQAARLVGASANRILATCAGVLPSSCVSIVF